MGIEELLALVGRSGYSTQALDLLFKILTYGDQYDLTLAQIASADRRAGMAASADSSRASIAAMQAALSNSNAERQYGLDLRRLAMQESLGMGQLDLEGQKLSQLAQQFALTNALDRERLDLQRMLGTGSLEIDRERLGLDQSRLASDDLFRKLGLIASLRGPRDAFQQQKVIHGLNAEGLSNAVDAIAGRTSAPAFQALQAAPEPVTLESFSQQTGLPIPGSSGFGTATVLGGSPPPASGSAINPYTGQSIMMNASGGNQTTGYGGAPYRAPMEPSAPRSIVAPNGGPYAPIGPAQGYKGGVDYGTSGFSSSTGGGKSAPTSTRPPSGGASAPSGGAARPPAVVGSAPTVLIQSPGTTG